MKPKLRVLLYLFLMTLGFIGFFITAFWGNPVSKLIAKVQVENFIKENINDKELKVYKIQYNPENSSYDTGLIDNNTKLKYNVVADELGVTYQNIIPNYICKIRLVQFPSTVFFLSMGIIGAILSGGYIIRKK